MKRIVTLVLVLLAALLAAFTAMRLQQKHASPQISGNHAQTFGPRLMLWAWETSEDLTTLDPHKAGVAFLAREVLLSDHLQIRPRLQPLQLSPNTYTMAVVRIETAPNFVPTKTLARQAAVAIAEAQQQTDAQALQVDFDALASQRAFYAEILQALHEHLRPTIPLSITALMSWCREGNWLNTLPIDEAVPMLFRMGGPASTRAVAPRSTAGIDDGPCNTSVGIATDEVWPTIAPTKRVYVFRPGSWTHEDLANINTLGYQSLEQNRLTSNEAAPTDKP